MKIIFKSLIIAVLFTFTLYIPISAKEISDKERWNLIGPVRSVHTDIITSSNLSGRWVQEPKAPVFTEIFDQMGNLIDRIHYSTKEAPNSPNKWDYIYDNGGNIIKKRYFNQEAVLTGEGLYTYDSKGFLAEIAYYSFGVDGTKPEGFFKGGEQYFYDSKGYLVLKNSIAEDHSLSTIIEVYVNDAKGNNIIKTLHSQCCTPSTLTKKVMTYNEKGQVTETKSFKGNDVLMNTINWSYDEMGNIANITYYESDGSLNFEETRSYEYDQVGNWIKSTGRTHYKISGQESVRAKFRKIIYYSDDQPQ